jgi:hypothetical protein
MYLIVIHNSSMSRKNQVEKSFIELVALFFYTEEEITIHALVLAIL